MQKGFMDIKKTNSQRWIGVFSILLVIIIAFMDRMNVSVLITNKDFLSHFGISGNKVAMGQLMSVFLFVYGLSAFFVSSILETFLGVRRGYIVCIAIWAVTTIISPIAGSFSILLFLRFILGISEGPVYSLKTMYVNDHFKAHERGKPNALATIGASLGIAIGVPLTTYLVYQFNWQVSFYIIGGVNLLIGLPLIILLVPEKVDLEKGMPQEKGKYLERLGNTIRLALTTPGLVWFMVIQTAHQSYLWGVSSWLPSYLLQEKGFSIKAMGTLSSLPFVVSLLASLLGGVMVDRMAKQKMAAFFTIGGILTAITITLAITVTDRILCVSLVILAQGFWGIQSPAIPTTLQLTADRKSVGSAYGMVNGVGNLLSSFVPVGMGALIGLSATGSFARGFSALIGLELLVALVGIRLMLHKKMKARIAENE
jgi:predicted MFS family arabinose efflux permease